MRKFFLVLSFLPLAAMAKPPEPCEPPCDPGRPPMHRMKEGKGGRMPPFLRNIDLTDEQQSEIRKLLKGRNIDLRAMLGEEKKAKAALIDLSFSNDFTDAKSMELIEKSLEGHRKTAFQKSKIDNAIFKLLTPEQQEKVKSELTKYRHK